ncbi:ABC transporter permease [Pseudoclavibacter chungangensis]|uniref:ABC transporter permease n=1 Tax=Pseudoclavibacter chungangensis TaxID=587635 RepID=A0A7J5BNY0_9MICO|nr:ABC transporter permease [Pseudoclavibacter chungangensis]KAB1654049.1 ABC transporter permease [Pseudoclavibacter chungangensis]NYJ66041.1 peptide/nickel transport system permease protein [Pseudoclavibacter chungangensis]
MSSAKPPGDVGGAGEQLTTASVALAASGPRTDGRPRSAVRAWAWWLLRRVGLAVLTLWAVSVIVFLSTTALGDPVRAILGKDYEVSPERVAAISAELHLDRSPVERYVIWLGDLLSGNLGNSVVNGLPVGELIGERLTNSLFLVTIVALIMIPLAMLVALVSARFRGGPIDQTLQVINLTLAGIPEFVTGILLVALFSTTVLHLLPAVTVLPPGEMAWQRPSSMVLPVATLVLAIVPYLARILRANLLEAMDADYAELARLKGVPESAVLLRHALPNTLVPAVQVTALQLAWLLGGVVLVEYLFNYPGIGALLVDSVRNADFPVVQALAMIIAAAYIVVNLVADLLSILLTPRARTGMLA